MGGENSFSLKTYMMNTSFHGFRYIAQPNRHWTERGFWIICCSVSWWISGTVISSAWNSFQKSAISFVVETSYTDWNTEFPAIYVCQATNEEKITKLSNRIYGDPHDYDLDEVIQELAFYSEHYFFTLQICGPNNKQASDLCYRENLSRISLEARSTCAELFRECKWRNIPFDCCEFFTSIDTDLGMCYALNSLQIRIKYITKYPMVSNRTQGPGSLRLKLNGENKIYVLGPLEVPTIITSGKDFVLMIPHQHVERIFNIKEIENQPQVRDLSIQQRKCRYADENYLDVFPYYSYSACLMQCRKDAQLQKCGCAHHHMPNTCKYAGTAYEKQCNFSGLACFQENVQELMVQKPPGSKKLGLQCDCLPSCSEVQLDVVAETRLPISENYSLLDISLKRLPTERYKRNVVNGIVGLTVSVGNAIALFLGASFLSFVELFYYFAVRPWQNYIFRPHSHTKSRIRL